LTDIIANRLDEKERLVIAFVFYEELSIKEIAEVLECSELESFRSLYKSNEENRRAVCYLFE
jgi:RNA polymerase, sigma 28 subunit, SigD/FliA/WhiG